MANRIAGIERAEPFRLADDGVLPLLLRHRPRCRRCGRPDRYRFRRNARVLLPPTRWGESTIDSPVHPIEELFKRVASVSVGHAYPMSTFQITILGGYGCVGCERRKEDECCSEASHS
jgi:hypothetical protein